MAFVLDQTKPNQKYFEAICGIPHPSTEEKAVSDYVCSVAEKLGLNYEQDKFWNVIVRKPASKGYEDAPVVMLEGHMDMVCVKTPESTHDFSHDPIEIYVDDKGDIRAKDTTLGADDGFPPPAAGARLYGAGGKRLQRRGRAGRGQAEIQKNDRP